MKAAVGRGELVRIYKQSQDLYFLPEVPNQSILKEISPGRDWGQEEKGMTGDEMDGWHH